MDRERQQKKLSKPQGGGNDPDAGLVIDTKETLKKETDELMDEIDELLEENAEEFVRNYIQKGGE
ncbi:MAG: ubiquitin-like protein Pup [Acidimicrobiia bacterium]